VSGGGVHIITLHYWHAKLETKIVGNNMSKETLKTFYQALSGLDPLEKGEDDPRYVPILQAHAENDPILKLAQRIEFSASESVSLLTGFRGNGKTTELYRLKAQLEASGCTVFRLDMDNYLNPTQPVEISDFLLSLSAALADGLMGHQRLKTMTETYFSRLLDFLQSDVVLDGVKLSVPGGAAALGLKLKQEPTFKKKVQDHLRGHLSDLVQQVNDYISEVVETLRDHAAQPDRKIVILVDSLEHIRGVGGEAQEVYESIVNTFSGHADKLALPGVHIVYTVPPFLILHANGAAHSLGGNPIVKWPNVHVRTKDGKPDENGLGIMRQVIERRKSDWQQIISVHHLDSLAFSTGGDLRDFFRQVREALVSLSAASSLGRDNIKIDDNVIDNVTVELQNQLQLMLTEKNKAVLARIHKEKQLVRKGPEELPILSSLLDANLIMNYQNGAPWFDVHPLVLNAIATATD